MSRNVDFIRSLDLKIIDLEGLPFSYRGDTSDEVTGEMIFNGGKYVLPLENFQPKVIIDCGAYIGYSTIFFANVYPDAQIYAIEPDDNNFRFLLYNTVFYDTVTPIHSAVWDKEATVGLAKTELGEAGYMTVEVGEGEQNSFKTTTIANLVREKGIEQIDFIKIDVQGAEKEIFSAPDVDEWLSKVNVLAIVLHDELRAGASYEFFKAISKYRWKFSTRGEVLIFVREDFSTEQPTEENQPSENQPQENNEEQHNEENHEEYHEGNF